MRGIILAGGTASRLWPITLAVSKQLLPVFDKPMIYYPLSTLIYAGIREVLIITTPADQPLFRRLLKDGRQWGLSIEYTTQPAPEGIAQALIIGAEFIADEPVALILGDNILHGCNFLHLITSYGGSGLSHIFAYRVPSPQHYGVIEFGANGQALSIEEKPAQPRSDYAVPGLYVYDNSVIDIARNLTPSARGELEITDVNKELLKRQLLAAHTLDRGTAWFDAGTFSSLMQAAEFVRVIEERQGVKIGCVEEAAWAVGLIDDDQLAAIAQELVASGYGQYLCRLLSLGVAGKRSVATRRESRR
jgi:glucose-1-phosphate thymidylyltransferase